MITDGPRRTTAANRPRMRSTGLLAAAFVVLALVAGCSGSDDKAAKGASNTVPSTQSPATFAGGSPIPIVPDTDGGTTAPTTVPNPDLPGDPLGYAKKLFEDWKSGDQAGAGTLAAPDAVAALFAKTYAETDDWSEPSCVGKVENKVSVSTCTWTSASGRLVVKITNTGLGQPQAVTVASFKKA